MWMPSPPTTTRSTACSSKSQSGQAARRPAGGATAEPRCGVSAATRQHGVKESGSAIALESEVVYLASANPFSGASAQGGRGGHARDRSLISRVYWTLLAQAQREMGT